MLRSLKDLEHYAATATDGEIGRVVDFLVDDDRWAIRYLVVETSRWLPGRRVLVSPLSFRKADWVTRQFELALTIDKVRNSPNVDTDVPVSRQDEREHQRYYGYPAYWGYSGVWGMGSDSDALADGHLREKRDDERPDDVHLRSVNELCGYHIRGSDDTIGHLADFVIDDATWTLHYLVVDTRNWWFGKKVLIAPQWTSAISYADQEIKVAMSRQQIKDSPEWNPSAAVNREYEVRLYDYYGRPVYWDNEITRTTTDREQHRHP